ncbi:TIGR01777 family protein [Xenorhabdus nematophila]|uniref:TIGR01777 family oxidoreductase n=1 Tax=Xenorhabdus nematophila TaxID=628 RepID=UPI00032759C0|nr:TIGR01777 family oxidoreductase [Xenorhabdus nematophila]CEF28530.1 putative cell division inhibitor, NAD(P)-binding [Xenorhabdus nematophila str. Websteri]AYA39769.1 TIGR01777 family protein [Xenorhabdus nematophila]KHD27752.1 epimerase [Xenorhabdus nematophila]MBA0018335.1 TIGR01777 family protein [Xenorhabdus nematophila]MCB4424918.1 TIGR01777 family protein [Xenorhabdus nematophila]
MRILITGGTGLIGHRLTCQLLSLSHSVTILSRSPQKVYSLFSDLVECWTTLNTQHNLNNFDAVINLAGEPILNKRWTPRQKERICQSRWKLTEQLSKLINASESPPSVFISGSATGYYGDQGQAVVTENVTENDLPHDEFSHQLCERWEQIALQAQSDKTRVCLLRTGIVLAKKAGALQKMLPMFRLGLGGAIGHGKQYMPWIHIEDMVNGIYYLLVSPELQGPFNMTSPYPVHNDQFSATLANVLHRPSFVRVPAFMLKMIMGEAAILVLGGQQAIPKKLEEAGFGFRYFLLEEALQDVLKTETHAH